MLSTSISLVLSLPDAQRSPKTGGKAANLSKLIDARFAVPRGFVISADAYRSHLWASGARSIASAAGEAEERERVRHAILSQEIPEDIWAAVAKAYERLSWQCGCADPKVAVRSSAIEEGQALQAFPGAYESILNVSGLDALKVAIRRVWASLWSGKAAAYRTVRGVSAEPAMAVIVQQMVGAQWQGTALTANPVTGDPHRVLVSRSMVGGAGAGESSHYEVDLHDGDAAAPTRSPDDMVSLVAEKAVLVEDTLGGPVEVEWAWEQGRLWFLQAQPMRPLGGALPSADEPAFFPVDWADETDAQAVWRRVTDRPVSCFSRSLLWEPARSALSPFAAAGDTGRSRAINGYVYRRGAETLLSSRIATRLLSLGRRVLDHWAKEAGPDIRWRCAAVMEADPAGMDHPKLLRVISDAAGAVSRAAEWLDWARFPCTAFPQMLREAAADLTDNPSLPRRLLAGLDDPTVMRDARLQELGERFAAAERSGKLGNERWWRAYKQDVQEVAREYGGSFRGAGEMCDIAAWKSWMEDTDAVFRIIGATARQGDRPSLVTLHCAAEADAKRAAMEAEGLLKGKARGRFADLLELSRAWLPARSEMEHVYTLSCTALRLLLAELAARMCASGLIVSGQDVFHLTMDDVLGLPAKPEPEDCASIAAAVARRKHEIWLETRLAAPEAIPAGAAPASIGSTPGLLRGRAIAPGAVTGRARVARSIEEAGEIEAGEVLVVKAPGLAWTPFLAVAGGLVAEQEPDVPDAAAVAGEYGVPVVVGCRGTIAAVRDGQRIVVNGSEGFVRLS